MAGDSPDQEELVRLEFLRAYQRHESDIRYLQYLEWGSDFTVTAGTNLWNLKRLLPLWH